MVKKKVASKAKPKTKIEEIPSCSLGAENNCKGFLALIIIALTWWRPAEVWANVVITILAAIILLGGKCCKK